MIDLLVKIGGLFAVLAFNHFIIDWLFQSHSEAMQKHNHPMVRAKHCLIYTAGFVPFLILSHTTTICFIISLNILFWSHFAIDTYIPVYLWARYIRKPPEMNQPVVEIIETSKGFYKKISSPDPLKGFVKFAETTLGKILCIVVDQIIHLAFLFPIIYMVLQ